MHCATADECARASQLRVLMWTQMLNQPLTTHFEVQRVDIPLVRCGSRALRCSASAVKARSPV